jgi:hypothetical protein
MRMAFSLPLAFLVLTVAVLPLVALAEPVYLPLSTGNVWSYEGSTGEAETMTVIGTGQVMGETVHIIDYSASTHNDPLQNYWTTGADGDVFLWGFFRDEDGGWGVAYQPPLLWVDGPAFVGETWACTTQVYWLPGEVLEGTFTYEFIVTWEGLLALPAGDFEAIAIGFTDPVWPPAVGRLFSPDGLVDGSRPDPDRWYSDGVGLVQYEAGTLYELVSHGISPVRTASWTRIKLMYR